MTPLANPQNVEAVAKAVAEYVRAQIEQFDSPLNDALHGIEKYDCLRNTDYWIGISAGLSIAQQTAFTKLQGLLVESDDDAEPAFDPKAIIG